MGLLLGEWPHRGPLFLQSCLYFFITEIDNLLVNVNSSLNYKGTYSHTLNCVYH